MAIEPDEQVAGRPPDAGVQCLRDPAGRILENDQRNSSSFGGGTQPLDRGVRGAAVGDEQLDLAGEILRGNVGHELLDVLGLVQHRDDDRDPIDRRRTRVGDALGSGRRHSLILGGEWAVNRSQRG